MSTEIQKEQTPIEDESSLSEETVRDLLTKEAGLEFRTPRSFQLPTAYDLHAFEGIGVSPEVLQEKINFFIGFLKDLVVIDPKYTIGEDEDRMRRRKEQIEKFGHIAKILLLHNKLRRNRLDAVRSQFDLWVNRSELPQFQGWDHAAEIKKLSDAFPVEMYHGYDALSLAKKMEIVERIENIVAEFLRLIGAATKVKPDVVGALGD